MKDDYLTRIKENSKWYDPNYVPIPKPDDWQPEERFREDHSRYPGSPRCQAWSGRTGEQCKKLSLKDKKKCRSHKGTVPSGVAAGAYKHGRYVKSVVGNPTISKAYQEALKQQGLLNLSPNIAMTDARLDALYQDDIYLSDEIVEMTRGIYNLWFELKQLIPRSNPALTEKMTEFGLNFEQLFRAMKNKSAFNKREDQLTERRRKLTETETKRQVSTAEVVLKAEVIGIFSIMGGLFKEVIQNNIEDVKVQRKVITDYSEVIDMHIVNFFSSEDK